MKRQSKTERKAKYGENRADALGRIDTITKILEAYMDDLPETMIEDLRRERDCWQWNMAVDRANEELAVLRDPKDYNYQEVESSKEAQTVRNAKNFQLGRWDDEVKNSKARPGYAGYSVFLKENARQAKRVDVFFGELTDYTDKYRSSVHVIRRIRKTETKKFAEYRAERQENLAS